MAVLLKTHVPIYFKCTLQRMSLASLSSLHYTTTAKKPQPEHFDIIIGGGGLVGTALAAALSKNKVLESKRVLLLEGAPPFKGFDPKGPYGNRVSAINHNTIDLFKAINTWDHMTAARVKSVKQMQVWDASSDALIQFHHEQFSDDVACIVENDLMLDAIYAQLTKPDSNNHVQIRNNARIESVLLPSDNGTDHSEVRLKNGDSYTCDLLIGADGANSLVRKQMGVDVYSLNYERMGLVATVELSESGDNSVAWQRFIPTGPVALLPLSETLSSLVWTTDISHAKELCTLPADKFVDALNEAYYKEYPKSDIVVNALNALNSIMGRSPSNNRQYPPRICKVLDNSRATFPLGFLHAASYVTTGAALIGDAAHRVHPLAGQGVNLGFSDVQILVNVLADAVYSGAKLGDKHYLLKYEQKSLAKNVPIMIGVHGLHTLYSTTFKPIVLLRSLGLQITHNIPQIKNIFMKRAMG